MIEICKHDILRRSCYICDLEDEVKELREEIERLNRFIDIRTPIADFDLVTSLEAEKSHIAEEVKELHKENKRLIEALEFYANPHMWYERLYGDEGKVARRALERSVSNEQNS